MARQQEAAASNEPFFTQPLVGTILTVLSGLSFLFVAMILPLVGKAGSVVPNAKENFRAFLAALMASLVLGALATFSKMERRKTDASPLPVLSLVLTGLCVLLLIALFMGLLKI